MGDESGLCLDRAGNVEQWLLTMHSVPLQSALESFQQSKHFLVRLEVVVVVVHPEQHNSCDLISGIQVIVQFTLGEIISWIPVDRIGKPEHQLLEYDSRIVNEDSVGEQEVVDIVGVDRVVSFIDQVLDESVWLALDQNQSRLISHGPFLLFENRVLRIVLLPHNVLVHLQSDSEFWVPSIVNRLTNTTITKSYELLFFFLHHLTLFNDCDSDQLVNYRSRIFGRSEWI